MKLTHKFAEMRPDKRPEDLRVVETGLRFQRFEHELKLNLMVSADCEPTSASRIRRSSESSAMDCHDSKLNGTVFGLHDWPTAIRGLAAIYMKLAEQSLDRHFQDAELRDVQLDTVGGSNRNSRR